MSDIQPLSQEYHVFDPERREITVVVVHPPKRRYWLHALLFLATIFTTLCIGAHMQDAAAPGGARQHDLRDDI